MVTNLVPCMFCGGFLEDMGKDVVCTACERTDPHMSEINTDPYQKWKPKYCRHAACGKELSTSEEVYLFDECMECARNFGIKN